MEKNANLMFFALLRSALNGDTLKENEKAMYSDDILEDLISTAHKHDLLHLIFLGIKQNGLITSESNMETQLTAIIYQTILRHERLNSQLKKVCDILEKAKIPFIPLKGSVICDYYPECWMRTRSDIDILVRFEDLETAISCLKESEPYRESRETEHDVSLYTGQGLHVEIHHDLVEEGRANASNKVLKAVWDNVSLKESYSYWHEMSDEYFYFYHIAHMAKHFELGGCGIRTFIDLWILDKINNDNKEKRDSLLNRGGLLKFADAARKLSRCWLTGEPLDEISKKMQSYILTGGVFGSTQNKIEVEKLKKGGKLGYAFSRIIVPFKTLKSEYPIIEKHRWLMPLMQVCRWIRIVFGGHLKRVVNQVSYDDISIEEVTLEKLFSDIGL